MLAAILLPEYIGQHGHYQAYLSDIDYWCATIVLPAGNPRFIDPQQCIKFGIRHLIGLSIILAYPCFPSGPSTPPSASA